MSKRVRELSIEIEDGASVSALLVRPPDAVALYALAHGAGAGMRHPFLETMAERLADRAIATLRYQFPYMQAGKRRPDPPRVLESTARAALTAAAREAGELPLVAGGKSMGGRITSQAQAQAPVPELRGIAFLGFPLHAAGKVSRTRADHLARTHVPLLFVQGTRDPLADLDELRAAVEPLGARARLHVIDGGDHSFHVLKRSGRTEAEALDEVADAVEDWVHQLLA